MSRVRRIIVAILLGGSILAALAGGAITHTFAAGPNANCTAVEASTFHDISTFAQLPNPTGGNGNFVSNASSTDCGTR